jgi:hypothetical protein|tara:strand:+ start:266 stop:2206 length:1941 start_codon:yes stop_codon:yes gene_type:complete
MARYTEKDLTTLRDMNKEMERLKNITEGVGRDTLSYKQSLEYIKQLSGDIKEIEDKRSKIQADYQRKSDNLNLAKSIEKLQKKSIGSIQKQLNLTSDIERMNTLISNGSDEQVKDAIKYNKFLDEINSGSMDMSQILEKMSTAHFGDLNDEAADLVKSLEKNPEILKKMGREQKFADMIDQVKDSLGLIDLKKTFTFAGLLALATQFAGKMLEIRQSLGTSAIDSARIAGNMAAAGAAAKVVGGNSQEAEAAVKGLVREFGSLSVVSLGVSTQLGLITGQFGISGDNAAKLLKSMDAISTASIETNLNLISTVGELARAEGVAPAQVLNDMASDTELFAKFGKDGGKNIGLAAIQAAKLGVNMATVAGIAESLLDFESSITDEMEAEVLLGRSLNLDKARELSLAGDLEGLQKEILKNVGSEAEFNAMNVVQRQALAKSLGMNVADLGKMVAGEKTSTQLAEERVEAQTKQMDLQTKLMMGTAAMHGIELAILAVKALQSTTDKKAVAGGAAKIGVQSTLFGLSLGTAAAALTATIVGIPLIAGLVALALGAVSKGKASGMADGGMVGKDGGPVAASDTIPTMLTPGEVVLNAAQQSNVAGAIGGGGGGATIDNTALIKTTNQLLTKVNEGINTLIRKTGEQALAS